MFKKISPEEIAKNTFEMVGKQWMLLTAGDVDNCNTMTVSWGATGVIWGKPAATCYVRPQRYTKQFMDSSEYFTMTAFPEEFRKKLAVCGSKSGRDIDKIKECGFTMLAAECGAPYMEEAEIVLVCKKLYAQPMGAQYLTSNDGIAETQYPDNDWHTMYIGEIVEVYVKE